MAIHPAGIKNTFMSHLVFWVLFLPVLTVVFLPLLNMNGDIDGEEMAMIVRSGVDVKELSARVNSRFSALFIETGIMPVTEQFFGLSGLTKESTDSNFAWTAANFAGNWVRGVWTIIYRAFWRLHALLGIYVSAIFAVCLPAVIDGFSMRARKKYQFQNTNPVVFYFSYHMAVLVVGLLIFLPLVPIPLTPILIGFFLTGLGVAMWWATANFQSGG